MADVIGAISGVIGLIETSIKIYDSAQKDIKLSETFETVRRRLPIIRDILETCKSHIEAKADLIPENVQKALDATLEDCDTKAMNLRGIFEKIIAGQSDGWERRYLKYLRRLGKGNKVEELMVGLTEDVQLIVNDDAVRSANQPQNAELVATIEEIKSISSSVPDEGGFSMTFGSGGGAQTTNVNKGSGPQNNISGNGTQYNARTQTFDIKQKEDFSFRVPVGLCLRQAPNIAPELFVGRGSELNDMKEHLHNGQHRQCLVLGGMGGIGKSRLAFAYAESQSDSYSSVFWLNAASEATLIGSFRSIASLIFEVQDPRVLDGKDMIERVHRWLSDLKNTGWLLVFDNYDDPDQFMIRDYYPPTSHGAIIVTTRQPSLIAGSTLTLHIKALQNIEDSLMILQTRSKRQNVQSDPYAKRLAERLKGLPLALATAGTYLQLTPLTFQRYLQEYEERGNVNAYRHIKLQDYERSLYTTWDISYAYLEKHYPDAAKLLKLLAYFGNQSFWHELFYAGLNENSPKWLYKVVADDITFCEVMTTLTEHHFLEVHFTSESWSMHECVYDWALTALNQNVEMEYYWYAFDCVYTSLSSVDSDSLGHINLSRLAGHAKRLVQRRFLENYMIYDLTVKQLDKVFRVSHLLQAQFQLSAAKQMYMLALAGYEKALGPDHTLTLDTVHNIGNLFYDQGKLDEAEQMYTRALAGYKEARGPDDTSTLHTVNNLGNLYLARGQLGKAEQMFIRALAGYEKALGPNHTSTLRTVNNIGNLFYDQGKLDDAEQMYTWALAGYKKALRPDHTIALSIIHNLGLLYRDMGLLHRDQGRLEKAEQMCMQALAGREKELGPNHIVTLATVHDLGLLLRDLGLLYRDLGLLPRDLHKLDEGVQMSMRALAGYENLRGPDHTTTLASVYNLGNLYLAKFQPDEAEQMYTRALAGYQKALGPDHTSTLCTINSLRLAYRLRRTLAEAEPKSMRAEPEN